MSQRPWILWAQVEVWWWKRGSVKNARSNDIFWKALALPGLMPKAWARLRLKISGLALALLCFARLRIFSISLNARLWAIWLLLWFVWVELCILSGEMKACCGPLAKLARFVAIQKSFFCNQTPDSVPGCGAGWVASTSARPQQSRMQHRSIAAAAATYVRHRHLSLLRFVAILLQVDPKSRPTDDWSLVASPSWNGFAFWTRCHVGSGLIWRYDVVTFILLSL